MENNDNLSSQQELDLQPEGSPEPEAPKASSPRRFHLGIHLILICVILVIAGTAVFRLHRWNNSARQKTDMESEDPSQFDIETLDMIIPMDSARLVGREDDGVTTILCLGNNPFSDDRGDSGLAGKIAAKTDSVIYDCSFPDSSAACKYPVYNPEYVRDHFNFYYVVECFRNNEFTAIGSIAGDMDDPRYTESVEVMRTVDMDKVDVIIVMYDSTDYNIGTPSDNPDNPYDVTAFTGGLKVTLENIQRTWPYIRIFVMSPTYAQYMDEDGSLHNGTITDLGNGTLNHYLVKEFDAVTGCGVSIIDNYFGTINEDNYQDYMADHMHYNDAGREALADRIADIINNHMTTVNSVTTQ